MKTISRVSIAFVFFVSCEQGAKDNKNEQEPFPTYDTTQPMEKINSPADSLGD
ncbi:MAG: hypothetical protein JNL60_18150 [Bacteroidia bacterium]|nr:hypothetical protein [Bacteroidia bacterium]